MKRLQKIIAENPCLRIKVEGFRPCSHFADTCSPETIFIADRLGVHTAMMLFATQIGKIPLRSKKWSEMISEYFPQSVNSMKRNKELGKVKLFQ